MSTPKDINELRKVMSDQNHHPLYLGGDGWSMNATAGAYFGRYGAPGPQDLPVTSAWQADATIVLQGEFNTAGITVDLHLAIGGGGAWEILDFKVTEIEPENSPYALPPFSWTELAVFVVFPIIKTHLAAIDAFALATWDTYHD
jgi:hypothetical protein